jgi:serine/threonine-protein phosphatase 5
VIDPNEIVVEASYKGPRLETIDDVTPKWIEECMEWHRDQKKLHRKYATMIINKAMEIFEKEDSLVRIEIDDLEEITVCGDVHG